MGAAVVITISSIIHSKHGTHGKQVSLNIKHIKYTFYNR